MNNDEWKLDNKLIELYNDYIKIFNETFETKDIQDFGFNKPTKLKQMFLSDIKERIFSKELDNRLSKL